MLAARDPAAPVPPSERLANLDALRAVALFGVLVVNLLTEFRVSIFEQFFGPASGSPLDRAIDRVVTLAIESKAFVLFSFLFGVGLAVQLDRARRAGRAFGAHVTRRLAALLAIGLVHLVAIWNGDILTEYAVAGLLALPLLACSQRALVWIALALFVVFVAPTPLPVPFPNGEAMRAHVAAANAAYAHGSFAEVLAFRVREIPPMLALDLGALPRTVGLFALGMAAWRAGVFTRPREHARLLVITATLGTILGGLGTLAAAGVLGGPFEPYAAWGFVLDGAAAIALALGYAAIVLLVHESAAGRRALSLVVPLGRMALTSYLAQSVIFGFVFYGYGLGRFGAMSVGRAAILGLAVYAAQAAASAWWLRRFRFGPVEWAWRCATYGAWQPLRLSMALPAGASGG